MVEGRRGGGPALRSMMRGMDNVGMVVKLTAAPGKRDELVDALRYLVDAVAEEEGTLRYTLHVEDADPDAVWFYELYTDKDALAAHGKNPAFATLNDKLRGLVGGPMQMHTLTPVASKGS